MRQFTYLAAAAVLIGAVWLFSSRWIGNSTPSQGTGTGIVTDEQLDTATQESTRSPVSAAAPTTPAPVTSTNPAVTKPETARTGARTFPRLAVNDSSAAEQYRRLIEGRPTVENANAYIQYAKTLDKCWLAERFQNFANTLSPGTDARRHADAQRIARQGREELGSTCDDLPTDAYVRSDAWMAELAAMGDEHSMLWYAADAPFWRRDIERTLRDPQKLIDYRENSRSYLNTLIDRGYHEAMIVMGSISMNSAEQEPSLADALAYHYAAARARGDSSTESKLLSQMDQRLSAPDKERALTFADSLMKRCCLR